MSILQDLLTLTPTRYALPFSYWAIPLDKKGRRRDLIYPRLRSLKPGWSHRPDAEEVVLQAIGAEKMQLYCGKTKAGLPIIIPQDKQGEIGSFLPISLKPGSQLRDIVYDYQHDSKTNLIEDCLETDKIRPVDPNMKRIIKSLPGGMRLEVYGDNLFYSNYSSSYPSYYHSVVFKTKSDNKGEAVTFFVRNGLTKELQLEEVIVSYIIHKDSYIPGYEEANFHGALSITRSAAGTVVEGALFNGFYSGKENDWHILQNDGTIIDGDDKEIDLFYEPESTLFNLLKLIFSPREDQDLKKIKQLKFMDWRVS